MIRLAQIAFTVNGARQCAEARAGESLLSVARRADIAIDAPCGGSGACGKCRVRLIAGDVESAPSPRLSPQEYAAGWRLACDARVTGDAAVEVPEAATAWRDRLAGLADPRGEDRLADARRAMQAAGLAFDSGLCAVTIALDPPTTDDTLPDTERAALALTEATGARRARFTLAALRALARVLRENSFSARCVIERQGDALRVLDVLAPGDGAPVAGLAVDLGTTSVSALLVDLADGRVLASGGAGNGQARYGADVISRIIESGRPGGGERLRRAVIDDTLRPLLSRLCGQAGVAPERIYRACVAGNTTMNHLLLGLDAGPVRLEPYIPTFLRCDELPAAALELGLHPDARLAVAPNVGSYVGGDITAGALASMLWNGDALTLLIDLGTNGELVLGNREFMMCCACSAGPAFEGGGISCGMRATDGAIEKLDIDPATLEPAYAAIGSAAAPLGLCGSGIIDAVAALRRRGLIDGRGRFFPREGCPRVRFDEHGMGRYVIAREGEAGAPREIAVTEADIDSFIRAKGAIYAAIVTMLEALGLSPDALERVILSGGIGGGIDIRSAVAVGMLPDLPEGRYAYIGNSALTGAWAMLASRPCLEKVDALARGMTYLELSDQSGYMDAFVKECFLPA